VNRSIGKEVGVNWFARSSDVTGKSGQLPYYSSGENGIARGVLDPLKVIGSSSFATILAQFTVGSVDVDVAIRALEDKGVTRRLAEPNLVALSGQQATFLAGGEIPYAVDQGDSRTTTEFKKYGVQLTFTPTVLRDDVVNLKLVPEFSQPDFSNTGKDGQPGLLTRRAETMVELRDGQTFVIAGLLDGFNQRDIDQIPGIGKVPVLGALFRSSGYRKRETELIIVVTPRIVKPMVPGTPLVSPLETLTSSSETDLFLNGQVESKPAGKKRRSKSGGAVGHILDIGG
jgi:pilus assembly protein CpaC